MSLLYSTKLRPYGSTLTHSLAVRSAAREVRTLRPGMNFLLCRLTAGEHIEDK